MSHRILHSHRLSLITLAALGALVTAPAQAQTTDNDSYSYFGLGVGQSRARIDENRIAQRLLSTGQSATRIDHNERDTAYKVFGGYQFNRNWGMELGYFRLGNFGFDATTAPAGRLAGDFRVQGANLDVVGTMPITENFSALARVGVQYARTRAHITSSGAVTVTDPYPSDREANVKLGLGLQYAVNRNFHLRAEVERLRISDAVGNHNQVAMYSVSMVFPFGRAAAPMRTSTAPAYVAPAYVAPAYVAPEPVARSVEPVVQGPVVAALPLAVEQRAPDRRRVSYSAESLFSFDVSELRPEGRAALDTFAVELAGTRFDAIVVEGHADRLGTLEYNQTLSLARAEAVKSYLVNTGRIDAAKITTLGKSEAEPVTLPEACRGKLSAPVIACLQPDRRVEIEVSGTR